MGNLFSSGNQGSVKNYSSGNKMNLSAASRIQSAADRNPWSATAKSGFKSRAQRAASKN